MYVWDADVSFRVKPNFLTGMANALPLFSTEQESNLAVSAEVAQSYPNPNVDGVAYLDDFEGSQESYSLSVFRESWLISAKPSTLDDTYHRGWLNWYNPYDQIATQEIWNRDVTASDSRTQVLHLYFYMSLSHFIHLSNIFLRDLHSFGYLFSGFLHNRFIFLKHFVNVRFFHTFLLK